MSDADNRPSENRVRSTCPSCGGSGQLGLFHGESRFMISWEECYECSGTGYIDRKEDEGSAPQTEPTPE